MAAIYIVSAHRLHKIMLSSPSRPTRPTTTSNFFTMKYLQPLLLLLIIFTVTIKTADAKNYDKIKNRSCFRSLKGMTDFMFDLAKNSDLATLAVVGESYLKNNDGRRNSEFDIPTDGHDIYALKITAPDSESYHKSEDKGKMLVTSGVHARELAPPELLARFIEELVDGYNKDAEITSILKSTEVHAILYVNPDGRWVAEKYPELYWRKNLNPNGGCDDDEYGVDINRNFDFMWGDQAGASPYPCDSDYHGTAPESEPETEALARYARDLFPEGQRKNKPEQQMYDAFGENITGMYIDIHSSGGYVYYPWGHADKKSPDDEALQALGRKISSFNDYLLWAGGQPDFVYEASGDTSDYLYAVMGVASLGFEIGDSFNQNCQTFESDVVPINMPALIYAAKIAQRPYMEVKGPDIFDLDASNTNGNIRVSARASDSKMVNAIKDLPGNFETGKQKINDVQVYLDVPPEDFKQGQHTKWAMKPSRRRLDSTEHVSSTHRMRASSNQCASITKRRKCRKAAGCSWDKNNGNREGKGTCMRKQNASSVGNNNLGPPGGSNLGDTENESSNNASSVQFKSGDEPVELIIDTTTLSPGRHTLFVQAKDSRHYKGPVTSIFINVPQRQRGSSLRVTTTP